MQVSPYLFFNGTCEAAFKFYAQTMGGRIEAMMTHAGTPAESQVPPEWKDKVMHARLALGDRIIMASDAPPGMYQTPQGFSISYGAKDPADAERVFRALAENGTIRMPLEETFWALRFGMCVDRFGIPWMVNCDRPT
ncbi:MAG: VOC family protein [Alphaproteobacteria bacterium]